jgi:hypothetical protein
MSDVDLPRDAEEIDSQGGGTSSALPLKPAKIEREWTPVERRLFFCGIMWLTKMLAIENKINFFKIEYLKQAREMCGWMNIPFDTQAEEIAQLAALVRKKEYTWDEAMRKVDELHN